MRAREWGGGEVNLESSDKSDSRYFIIRFMFHERISRFPDSIRCTGRAFACKRKIAIRRIGISRRCVRYRGMFLRHLLEYSPNVSPSYCVPRSSEPLLYYRRGDSKGREKDGDGEGFSALPENRQTIIDARGTLNRARA